MFFDVIIVGAGPAGCSCALKLDGLSVLLVDGQSDENPKPCGGLLAPDAQKYFARSDFVLPKDVLVDPQIFSVKTVDLVTGRIRYYQRSYLNMDRLAFDRMLLSKIPDNVTVIKGRCSAVSKDGDGIAVTVNRETYLCRYLVGADGANSIVRKSFFPDRKIKQYVAIQETFADEKRQNPFYSCVFDRRTSESCSWMIHKNGHVIYGGCFDKKGCREAYAEQKKRLSEFTGLDLSSPEKTEACLCDRPKKMRDFVTGDGNVFLIGEAAGFISPSSFEGISPALISGELLASALTGKKGAPDAVYRRLTRNLRYKLLLKTGKRWFMYTPWVRDLIMRSGLASIKHNNSEE